MRRNERVVFALSRISLILCHRSGEIPPLSSNDILLYCQHNSFHTWRIEEKKTPSPGDHANLVFVTNVAMNARGNSMATHAQITLFA